MLYQLSYIHHKFLYLDAPSIEILPSKAMNGMHLNSRAFDWLIAMTQSLPLLHSKSYKEQAIDTHRALQQAGFGGHVDGPALRSFNEGG